MRITIDYDADAAYVYLTDEPYAYGKDVDSVRRVDYDSEGRPRGIEFLGISHGVNLDDLPGGDAVLELLERDGVKVYA